MAANTINVGVNVSDNGTVAQLQSRLKAATKDLASLRNVMRQTGSGVAGMGGPSKQENIDYRNARGVAGTGGGGSRDFAKQAQGLGGLVRLYATFAANIFAVSAAFNALDKAAQFEQMIQGAKALEATTGASLRSIANQMKAVTDGALSMQESMRLTALGSAAGLSEKKILDLTKGAKGASLALGRDMGDSIDRVIRGVAKLEPELLDELGVVTRAQEAYKKYAQSIGTSADALTSYQKTIAYSNAVSIELLTKFGAIADKVPANPYAKFLGQLKDVGTELLTLVNNVITPVVSMLANNIELMFAGVLLLVKSLTLKAIPEISKMFSVSPAVVTARHAALTSLLADIDAGNRAEVESTRKASVEIIQIKEREALALSKMGARNINALATAAFKTSRGQTAKNLLEVGSVGAIVDDSTLRKAIPSAMKRESKVLTDYASGIGSAKEAEAANVRYVALASIEKEIVTEEKRRLALTEQIDIVLKGQEATELKIADTLRSKNKYSLAEREAAILNLEVKKLEGAQIVQNTLFLRGQAAAEIERAKQAVIIEEARKAKTLTSAFNVREGYNKDPSGKENKNFGLSGEMVPNIFGKIEEATDRVKGKIGDMVSKVGSGLGKVVGFLGTWGVAAMIAYEALSFLADKAGFLNKKTDELNTALEEGTKVLETAKSSYLNYTKAVTASTYSLIALQSANDIAANTFEQGTASIQKQIEVFTAWREAGGWISSFWDKIGTSKFDTLKENISGQVAIMSKEATGAQAAELKALEERISGTKDSAEGLQILASAYVSLEASATRAATANRNQNSFLKEFQDKANAAGTAIDKINEKEWIKDEKRRTIVEFLKDLQKGLNDITLTADAKINLLAKVPEGLNTKAGKQLEEVRRVAAAIQAITEATGLRQKELTDAQDIYLGKYKDISKSDRDKLNTGPSNVRMMELVQKEGDLSRKLMEENLSIEEVLKIQSTQKLLALEKDYVYSTQRDFENKKLERLDKYAKDSKDYQSKLASYNIEKDKERLLLLSNWEFGTNIFDKAIAYFEAWWNSISFIPNMLKTDQKPTAPKAPKGETSSAIDIALKPYKEELKRLQEQLKQLNAAETLKKNIDEQTALGTTSRDAQLKQNQQRMDLLNNEITAQQKLIELEADKIANAEKYSGLININLLNAKAALEITKNEKEFKKQELEAQMKFNSTEFSKSSDKSQAKILMNKSIDAARKAQENADAKVNSIKEEAKNAAILTNYRRQEGLQADILLENSKSAISIAKDLNNLSNQEVLDKEYINNLQTIINKEDALNAVKKQGNLTDVQTLELEALGRSKQTLNLEKAKNDILEERAALQRKFNTDQESIQQKIDAGLRNNTSTAELEVELIQQKIAETKRLNIENGLDGKELERNLALNKEILAFIERQHEAKKRDFINQDDKPQIIYDEAAKRARDFAANMKDTVTGVFDAVYSGMDAAIDLITTKMMNGTKITFKEISDLFRNTVAEGFREMAAEQLKSSARNLIRDIMGAVMPGLDLSTNEEKALNYAERTAKATEAMANMGPGGASAGNSNPVTAAPSIWGKLFGTKQTGAGGFEDYKNAPDTVDMTTEAATAANEAYYGSLTNISDEVANLNTSAPTLFGGIANAFGSLFGGDGIVMKLLGGLGSGISGIFQNILGIFTGGGAGGGAGGGIGGLLGGLGGLFSGDGMGSFLGETFGMEGFGGWLSGLAFANGGIMSEYGALKLNKYASGGIANSPQMAIYGEGRMNEAYVPLPDGRTIPVTMQGNSNSGSGPINVVVNVDASGNSNTQTTGATNADDAKRLGMIISGKVREEIVNQQRSGGLLNKR